jgi:hypothetical protein
MPKLYVSYRRQDSAAHAGRLIDALEHRLGQGGVLRPERLITSGEDWGLAQHRILRSCTLMLVVIGPSWVTADDGRGVRRLHQPDDTVRGEIADALQREIPVVPVLVGGASYPVAEALPPDIARLTDFQAMRLRDDFWDRDVASMLEQFERLGWDRDDAASPAKPPVQPAPPPAATVASAPLTATGPDAFISHASEDHALAELIVAGLEKQGHRCWLAPRDIPPGTDSYARAITGAIKTSRLMVVIVSAHANQSDDVLNEITLAKNYKVPRLPVRIDAEPLDDGLAYFFSQSQWLDVPGQSHKEIAQRLVTLVNARKPRS